MVFVESLSFIISLTNNYTTISLALVYEFNIIFIDIKLYTKIEDRVIRVYTQSGQYHTQKGDRIEIKLLMEIKDNGMKAYIQSEQYRTNVKFSCSYHYQPSPHRFHCLVIKKLSNITILLNCFSVFTIKYTKSQER